MNYKDVFQLAESKGYIPFMYWTLGSEDLPNDHNTNRNAFIESCLIQKWLRHTHGIHVQPQKTFHNKTYIIGKIPIEFRIVGKGFDESYGQPISYINASRKKFNSYEEALLQGITDALETI